MVHVAKDSRALAEDILSSARARQQGIADRKSGAARFLSQCNDERCAVAEELHRAADDLQRRLMDGDEARLETFRQTHNRTAGRVGELVAGTRRFLRDCDVKRRDATRTLRLQLTNGDNARLEAFGQMHKRTAGRVAELAREVRCQLEESHNDSLAAHAVWNDLASARSGVRKATRKR